MEKPDLCTSCHKKPAIVFKGPMRLCEDCGVKESIRLNKALAGGIELPPMAPAPKSETSFDNFLEQQFPFKPPESMPGVKDVEVVFTDSKGSKRLVKTNQHEKAAIHKMIFKNRKHDKSNLMFRSVIFADPGILIELDAIMRMAAAGDKTVFFRAKQFLDSLPK